MKVHICLFLFSLYLLPYCKAANTATATATATARAAKPATPPAAPSAPAATPSDICTCVPTYAPVCGTDGVSYSNECTIRCVSAQRVANGLPPIYTYRQGPCPQVTCRCNIVYQPLCGSDGRLYSNRCFLDCENSRRALVGLPPLNPTSASYCPTPACPCSIENVPVCGSDGITYRNICNLQCANRLNQEKGQPPVDLRSSGSCTQENCGCSGEYTPLCASDGRTYNNRCLFDCENRRRAAQGLPQLTITNNGPCSGCNCTGPNDPVCASDRKTYNSPCFLQCENDARARQGLPPLTVLFKGICECNCNSYVDPVCGTDDRDYANICLLQCESVKRQRNGQPGIRLAYLGPCACDCRNCNIAFDPVCGSNGRTFWNRCWLDCYSVCNQWRQAPAITPVKPGFC